MKPNNKEKCQATLREVPEPINIITPNDDHLPFWLNFKLELLVLWRQIKNFFANRTSTKCVEASCTTLYRNNVKPDSDSRITLEVAAPVQPTEQAKEEVRAEEPQKEKVVKKRQPRKKKEVNK